VTKSQSNKVARIYTASLSYILPLPIANVAPDDPSHLNAYPEYPSGTIVLALYPETTSFYKAEVVASPKEMLVAGARVSWDHCT
jgi:SAGA-associated factor 29